jgi:hypothetical protein
LLTLRHLSLGGNRIRGILNLSGQKGVRKQDKKIAGCEI